LGQGYLAQVFITLEVVAAGHILLGLLVQAALEVVVMERGLQAP